MLLQNSSTLPWMKEGDHDTLRILEEHHVIQEDGWVKLSPLLLESLKIKTGDLLSFLADEQGFRVKGGKKPPYVHASSEQPPQTLKQPALQTDVPLVPSPQVSQLPLFEPGQTKPPQRRRTR